MNVFTYIDNHGACDLDGVPEDNLEPCFENETSIDYILVEGDYHEIATHRKGTEWDFSNEKMLTFDEKIRYSYQDGEYKEKK